MKCITTIYHKGICNKGICNKGDIVLTVCRGANRLGIIYDVCKTKWGDIYYNIHYPNGCYSLKDPEDVIPIVNGDINSLASLVAIAASAED